MLAGAAVDAAVDAFAALARLHRRPDHGLLRGVRRSSGRPGDDRARSSPPTRDDIARARSRRDDRRPGSSSATRCCRAWSPGSADGPPASSDATASSRVVEHAGWELVAQRAPLGVVGFVFEGRPNVFADAAGVVRTGNTVVFRIGSDALGTARAIVEHALAPALTAAGLPAGTVTLVESAAHAAGWALFSDPRLALAVARGSGAAVAQLGSVARQAGVPVSLHGTGGAWLVAAPDADAERLRSALVHSLDRKVCNTVNVCCVVRSRADELIGVCSTRPGCRRATGHRRARARHARRRWLTFPAATRRDRGGRARRGRQLRGVRHADRRRPAGPRVGMGGLARVHGACGGHRRRRRRGVQRRESALRRLAGVGDRPRPTSGSMRWSTRRSSATGSLDGSTVSTHSGRLSSVCRTGRAGASSDAARSCRATACTPCVTAPGSTDVDSPPLSARAQSQTPLMSTMKCARFLV